MSEPGTPPSTEPPESPAPPSVETSLAASLPAESDAPHSDSSAPDSSAPDSSAPDSSAPEDNSEDDGDGYEPPGISVRIAGATDVGQVRTHNEDNFFVADLTTKERVSEGTESVFEIGQNGILLAVCDGMGGAAAGEVASKMATEVIYDRMLQSAGHADRDHLGLDVIRAVELAGLRILEEASANRAFRGMGTTATAAALVDDVLLIGEVGDSRAYVIRGGEMNQATRDQSLVNHLIEMGQLTEAEAENFEHNNIILQALGTQEMVQVDLTYVHLCRDDIVVLCSDGLSGMISDETIRDIVLNSPDFVNASQALIDAANMNGGHDNITVVIAEFTGDGMEAPDTDVEDPGYRKYTLPPWVDDHSEDTRNVGPGEGPHGPGEAPLITMGVTYEVDTESADWAEMLLADHPEVPLDTEATTSTILMWVAVALFVAVVAYLYLSGS